MIMKSLFCFLFIGWLGVLQMHAQGKDSKAFPRNGYLIFSPSYSYSQNTSFFNEPTNPYFEYRPFYMYGFQVGFGRKLSKHIDYRHLNLVQLSAIYEYYSLNGTVNKSAKYAHIFSDDFVFKIQMKKVRLNFLCGLLYGFYSRKESTQKPDLPGSGNARTMDIFWGVKGGLGLGVQLSNRFWLQSEFSYLNMTKSDRHIFIYRVDETGKVPLFEKNYALRENLTPFSFINLTFGLNYNF